MSFSISKQTRSGHQGRVFSSLTFIYKKGLRRCSAILVAIGFAGILLASCGSGKSPYQFKTAQEGISHYRAFVKELKTCTSQDMSSIAKDIAAWQELEDSVNAVILRDTTSAKSPHYYPHETVASLHDTAKDEFLNRVIGKPRTLQDVLTLKLEANRLVNDKTISEAAKAAAPFFLSLDSVNIYNMDCGQLLRRYQAYLSSVERSGIHSKEQLLMFMREEDRLFRSFATHLSEMDGRSATDITRTTERIYAQLSRDSGSQSLSSDELFILLTMRTNRRLLVSAQGCLADIRASKVKTDDQHRAYLMMLLQPFTSISDFGLAVLTDTQKATFADIAKEASSQLVRLAGQDQTEREQVARIADLMIKIYISSL